MAITDTFTLPEDLRITPVAQLSSALRAQAGCADEDFAVTRPQSRTPSKIVDPQAAELLRQFATPSTIVEAVLRFSRSQQSDPERVLVDAFPLLEDLILAGLLVAPNTAAAAPIVPSLQPGERVDEFEIVACVQALEDTELYQARHTEQQQIVALKLLRPGAHSALRAALGREAAVLRRLDGSLSPRLVALAESGERPYLAMTWSLSAQVTARAAELGPPGDPQARRERLALCLALLDAFARLHGQGILHGDIHPNNILVAADGDVTLIDFGLARLDGGGELFGAPPRGGVGVFFEPEYATAFRGQRPTPPASYAGEQYALAALSYMLLTDHTYVDFALEKEELFRQIAEEAPLPFVAHGVEPWPAVEQVLARALSKDPASRYSSVAEFAQMLRLAATGAQPEPAHTAGSRPDAVPAAAQECLEELLGQLGPGGALFREGISLAPTASVTFGAAGVAYGLYQIACARGDGALLALADIWATQAARAIGRPDGFYNAALELSPETVGTISIYHTPSGVHAVQALIGGARGDTSVQLAAIEGFVAASRGPCDSLDLTLGRSSVLVGSALLLDALPPGLRQRSEGLIQHGNASLDTLWAQLDSYAPIAECREIDHLGIAHGWAGMLFASLRWCQSTGRPLPAGLAGRLQQLAAYAEPVGRGARWPWVLGRKGGGYSSMPGWCNGSAGYVSLWLLAEAALGGGEYGRLAEHAAWNAWEQESPVGNLCCGLAGQAYALLSLYRQSGERSWLQRAREIARRAALSRVQRDGSALAELAHFDHSLYKGRLGIAVLAADLERPAEARMPFFEGEE